MPWPGIIVLTLISLMLGYLLWNYLSSYRMGGHKVDSLRRALPDLPQQGLALIYCFNAHCGPCLKMTPAIEKLAESNPSVFKLDISEHSRLAREFGIRLTPTTLLVKDNRVVKVLLGAKNSFLLETFLRSSSVS